MSVFEVWKEEAKRREKKDQITPKLKRCIVCECVCVERYYLQHFMELTLFISWARKT